jgi:lipopolysaccharide transport system permease protein
MPGERAYDEPANVAVGSTYAQPRLRGDKNDVLRRLWAYRSLLVAFTRRQYQLRYRQSFAGFAWAIFMPLVTLVVGTVVFKRIANVDTGETNYAVFTLAALAPWTFFASSLQMGAGAVVNAAQMVAKLAFPRAVLPLSLVGIAFIDFGISMAIFVAVAFIMGEGLRVTFLLFPALIAIEIVLVLGLVFLFSAMNVFARDVRLGVPLMVQLWLFLTPVMYPLSRVPDDLRIFYLANPMTGLVELFRRIALEGHGFEIRLLLPALIASAVAIVVGTWYFKSTEPLFADVV